MIPLQQGKSFKGTELEEAAPWADGVSSCGQEQSHEGNTENPFIQRAISAYKGW